MNNNVTEIVNNVNIEDFLKTQDPDIISSLLFSNFFNDDNTESINLFLFEKYFSFTTNKKYSPNDSQEMNDFFADFNEKIKQYKEDNVLYRFLSKNFTPQKSYDHFVHNVLYSIEYENNSALKQYAPQSVKEQAYYFFNFIAKLSKKNLNGNSSKKWKIIDQFTSVEDKYFYLTLIKEGVFTLFLYNQGQLSISSVNDININTNDPDSILKSIIAPAVTSTNTPLIFQNLNQDLLSVDSKKQKYYNENYNNKLLLYLESGEKEIKLFVDALSYFINESKISQTLLESYLLFQMIKMNYIIDLIDSNYIRLIERGVLLYDFDKFKWYENGQRSLIGYVTPDDINNFNNKKEDLITINSKYLFFLLKILLIKCHDDDNEDEFLDFDNYTKYLGSIYFKNLLFAKKGNYGVHLDIIDSFNPYFDKEEDHIKYIKLKIGILNW